MQDHKIPLISPRMSNNILQHYAEEVARYVPNVQGLIDEWAKCTQEELSDVSNKLASTQDPESVAKYNLCLQLQSMRNMQKK